jgi:hypothetical protein
MEEVKQEFSGSVGDVAGRDIVNHNYTQGRLLTKSERVELHRLVQRLESDFGELGWQTWKFLHRTIGVENIESMCLAHRDQAETILNLLLERARLQAELEGKEVESEQSDQEITRLTKRNSQLAEQLKQVQAAYAVLQAKIVTLKPAENCPRCKSATEVVAQTRKRLLISIGVAALAVFGAVVFAYQAYAVKNACEYGDKFFAIGSIINNSAGQSFECIDSMQKMSPQWRAISPLDGQKTIRQNARRSATK